MSNSKDTDQEAYSKGIVVKTLNLNLNKLVDENETKQTFFPKKFNKDIN